MISDRTSDKTILVRDSPGIYLERYCMDMGMVAQAWMQLQRDLHNNGEVIHGERGAEGVEGVEGETGVEGVKGETGALGYNGGDEKR